MTALWGAGDPFAPGTKGQLVTQFTQSVTVVVSAKDGNVFGETTMFIDGRRSEVRTQETTAGNLSPTPTCSSPSRSTRVCRCRSRTVAASAPRSARW